MYIRKMEKEAEKKTSKLAIASFVLGLINFIGTVPLGIATLSSRGFLMRSLTQGPLAFLLALIYIMSYLLIIPYILSLLAIIFGVIAFVRIRKNPLSKGRWMAITGIFLGILIPATFILISSYNLICLVKDDFPQDYDIKNIIIYNSRSTMVGGYYITIYGDGSAYYLNHNVGRDKKLEAKFGILSQEKVKGIIDLFKDNNFVCLKETYGQLIPLTDMGTDYVSLTINGITKRVSDYGRSAPSSFREILNELRSSVEDLPQIKPEDTETYQFCRTIMEELGKEPGVSTEYWMDGCRSIVNASFQK